MMAAEATAAVLELWSQPLFFAGFYDPFRNKMFYSLWAARHPHVLPTIDNHMTLTRLNRSRQIYIEFYAVFMEETIFANCFFNVRQN